MELLWGVLACIAVASLTIFSDFYGAVPVSPRFYIGYGVALFMTIAFTSALLVWRARLTGSRAVARLAAAYVAATPLVLCYVATLPGALFDAPQASTAWYWLFWSLTLPIGIMLYARERDVRSDGVQRHVLIGLFAALIAIVATVVLARTLHPTGAAVEGLRIVRSALIGIAEIVAFVLLVAKGRRFSAFDLWLAVALFTLGVSMLVLSFGLRSADTVGGNMPRLLFLTGSAIVLFAMVREFARLVERGTILERYATMAEASPAIVFLTDPNGLCTHVNDRWTYTTGQSSQEALGTGWRDVVHPDDLGVSRESWKSTIAERAPHEGEVRYRMRDGTYRWHLSRAVPVRNLDGALVGWFGTALDIHDQVTAFEREHAMLQRLQTAFLPPYLPQVDGVLFDAAYKAATHESEVGGDWYDAFVLRDSRVALSVGDVAGHGWEAASAMVRLRETLRAVTGFSDADPAEVLQLANEAFLRTHPDAIATVLFALYEPSTRRLCYASAGHPAPALLRAGTATSLRGGGLPFGVMAHATYSTHEMTLHPGDAVALYTDGLIESRRNVVEGEKRLLHAFSQHGCDAHSIVNELVGEDQADDVALLIISPSAVVAAHQAWHFRSDDAMSAQAARSSFVSYLVRNGFDEESTRGAEMAFGELVGNVVRHAPGPIEIDLSWQGNRPLLVVRDRGSGFTKTTFALPEDPFAESGRGLFLVTMSASEPSIRLRRGGGSEVSVYLDPAQGGMPARVTTEKGRA